MKKLIRQVMLTCAAVALLSGVSVAKDPLLGGSSGAVVVADKDLADVKGSGSTTANYSFLGAYYGSYAHQYAAYGDYYNYVAGTGASSTTTTYYNYAWQYAYYSYLNYVNAYNSARAGT